MLPCTQSKTRRGKGDPAGGWAETLTGLWTTSVTPAHQHSSTPTADRWADYDLTRRRSYRADDSPGKTDQEESTERKEHRRTKRIQKRYDKKECPHFCLRTMCSSTTPFSADCHKQCTCELSKKLLGRDIGEAVEVPAIAMATVWLIMLLPSPSASSPLLPIAAPWGPPGRPHWLWDSSDTKRREKKINKLTINRDNTGMWKFGHKKVKMLSGCNWFNRGQNDWLLIEKPP